jgi:hypothetical protein
MESNLKLNLTARKLLIGVPCIAFFILLLPFVLHFLHFDQAANTLFSYTHRIFLQSFGKILTNRGVVNQNRNAFPQSAPVISNLAPDNSFSTSNGPHIWQSNFTLTLPLGIFDYFAYTNLLVPSNVTNVSVYVKNHEHKTYIEEYLGLRYNVVFLIPLILYALYPLRYRGEEYFKKRNYRSVITEYKSVKNILSVEIPLLLVLTSVTTVLSNVPFTLLRHAYYAVYFLLTQIQPVLLYAVVAGLIWLLCQRARRDFYFYLAKTYIKKISENLEEVDKIDYLINGLRAYNKYLIKKLKLRLTAIEELFSKIMSESDTKTQESMNKICASFDESNKLNPLRTLSLIMPQTNEFLAERSFWDRIQTWLTLAITGIPVVISIIQILFQKQTVPH